MPRVAAKNSKGLGVGVGGGHVGAGLPRPYVLALPHFLHMIRMADEDGFGPVELFQEHQSGQFMGEGQARQG